MKNKIPLVGVMVLAFASLGLGFWLIFAFEIPNFSFLNHSFQPKLRGILASSALFALTLFTFWLLYSRFISRLLSRSFQEVLRHDAFTYLPLIFTALAPITLSRYLSAADILARTRLLLNAAIALVVYLKIVQFRSWRKPMPVNRTVPGLNFSRLSSRKKLAALFAASLLLTNLGSVLILKEGVGFSGDEPHYLLMSHSLLHDGDLDLANNYDRKDYNAYMLKPITIPQRHAISGQVEGSLYSFHSPGTAFLMLPFYAAGSLFGKTGLILWLRFGMSLFGALFGLQVFLFARETWGDEKQAFLLWGLIGLATPVYFHSLHIYPEIIIAFFSLFVFRILKAPSPPDWKKLLLGGFFISTFIWFHALKYIFLSGPLLLYGLWILKKKHARRRDFISFLISPAVMTIIYLVFQKALYGSYSLTAISVKGSLEAGQTLAFAKELFTAIPFRFRWETLAGYLFDQRDGLLFYAPLYVFSFLGFVDMARKKAGGLSSLLWVISPYVLVQAFLTQRGSYAPQARTLAAVIWALMIGLGWFLARNKKRIFSALFVLASAVSLLLTWLLIKNPPALYQETTVGTTEKGGRLFYILSHLHFHLTDILPSFIKSREGPWLPNVIWPGIFLAFILVYALIRGENRRSPYSFGTHAALALAGGAIFFSWFVLNPRTVLVNRENVIFPTGVKAVFYSLSRVARQVEPGQFLLPEDNRAYVFSLTSRRPIKNFRFEFGSPAGDYEAGLYYFDAPLFKGQTSQEIRSLEVNGLPAYKFKNAFLYSLTIRLDGRSGARTAETPFSFRILPSD